MVKDTNPIEAKDDYEDVSDYETEEMYCDECNSSDENNEDRRGPSLLEIEAEAIIGYRNRFRGPLDRFLSDQEFFKNIKEHEEMFHVFGVEPSFKADGFKVCRLPLDSQTGQLIQEFFTNSTVPEHYQRLVIKNIWSVHDLEQNLAFMRNGYDKEVNYLLTHGTKRHNLASILQDNLRLSVAGGCFGPGLYLADRVSKSAQYTDPSGPLVMLLCQVALGNRYWSD